jgi:Uma2 family endonuclease
MVATQPKFWTYDDLFALPDDGRTRYEIIDGRLYELPTPWTAHASTIMALLNRFIPAVSALGGTLLTGPLDVFFPGADPVEPDIIVLFPDRLSLVSDRGIECAPDLLVEVLCHVGPEHDRVTKRSLYARAGVPEFWLVSPEAATIEVLVLNDGVYRTHVRAAGDELVTSSFLTDLSFPASAAFPSLSGVTGLRFR